MCIAATTTTAAAAALILVPVLLWRRKRRQRNAIGWVVWRKRGESVEIFFLGGSLRSPLASVRGPALNPYLHPVPFVSFSSFRSMWTMRFSPCSSSVSTFRPMLSPPPSTTHYLRPPADRPGGRTSPKCARFTAVFTLASERPYTSSDVEIHCREREGVSAHLADRHNYILGGRTLRAHLLWTSPGKYADVQIRIVPVGGDLRILVSLMAN